MAEALPWHTISIGIWGLVGDFGGYDNTRLTLFGPTGSQTVDTNGSAYTYLFGPRVSFREHERFTPFIQAPFGVAHASSVSISGCTGSPSCTPLGSENAFAMTAGGGLDITLHRHIALRLFQAEYLMTRFKDSSSLAGETERQNNVRLSTGIVFRFGGHTVAIFRHHERGPLWVQDARSREEAMRLLAKLKAEKPTETFLLWYPRSRMFVNLPTRNAQKNA